MRIKTDAQMRLTPDDVREGERLYAEWITEDGATFAAAKVYVMAERTLALLLSPHRDGVYSTNARMTLVTMLAHAKAYNEPIIRSIVEEMIVDD